MEAHDLTGLAYPDYPHPAYRNYVQHGGNAGEFKIPETNLYVDGYHEESNTVFQFHGCFWHGCERCFPNRHEKHFRLMDRTPYEVFEKPSKLPKKSRTKDSMSWRNGNVSGARTS